MLYVQGLWKAHFFQSIPDHVLHCFEISRAYFLGIACILEAVERTNHDFN
jgi:hypothetical protein